ncbi:MAG: cyclic nucleotide-binding domain-containing protein, partial [Cyanobacteria bacterium K_DeepCast_35m_m2_023]|nr:cyclic nucleotide-binding domain-containing protein [Cyanobacteria bacterium K_DeepCast_35m_m2_023]
MSDPSPLPIPQQGWLANQSRALQQVLRTHVQWVRYRTGQPLLQADRLPHQVMVIAEGSVRLVAQDAAGTPFTLARLGPGEVLGWCGLVRAVPCETALASEPTLVAAIPAPQFLRLLGEEPTLRQSCLEPDRSELAALLLPWLARQPQRIDDLPGLLAELWRPEVVQLLSGEQLAGPLALDPSRLWLASAPLLGAPGEALSAWQPREAAGLPLGPRLLGLERQALAQALQPRLIAAADDRPAGAPRAPQELWDLARPADDLPAPIDPRDLGLPSQALRLPPLNERGETSFDSAMVCLQRLASRYRFPFPRESVLQVLADCDGRLGGISLLHLGQLLESLGLEVRPLTAPARQLHRLEPPALARYQGRFVLVEDATPRGLVLADPAQGLITLELSGLAELWPDGVELMLVRPADSPADDEQATRFDLAWFWGAMGSYRPQLLLLLLTGFVGKMLELVFPLAVLQIIDVVVGSRNLSLLLPIGVVMGVTIAVMAVLGTLRELLLSDLSDRIDTRLGSQIVGHLFRLPLRFFDRRTVGDLASRFYDLQRVRVFLTDTAVSSSLDLLFLPILAIVLLWIAPVMAAVMLAQVPILLLVTRLSREPIKTRLTRRNRAWSRAQGFLVEVLTAIRTVKSQNFASQARWQWLERYRRFTGEDYRLSQVRIGVTQINTLVTKVSQIALML